MSRPRNHGSGDHRLAEGARAQAGLASLGQLRAIGVSKRAAAYRAEQGRLHRIHRGVYAVGYRSIDRTGELHAALLACGRGSIVSHGTAAALWGLRDQRPALIDVTVPCEAGRKLDGIRCRRCRYPDPEEVVLHEEVLRTTPARTIVDLAGMLGARSTQRVVERAAVLKLLDLKLLDRAIARAKGRRGIGSLCAILEDWRTEDGSVPDVRSDFEALALPRLLAGGLPAPLCNKTLELGDERLMVDFLWEQQRLVVETDGGSTHDTPVAFQRDRRRDQILLANGYRVARATWRQIHGELDAVVARIARALAVGTP